MTDGAKIAVLSGLSAVAFWLGIVAAAPGLFLVCLGNNLESEAAEIEERRFKSRRKRHKA